MPFEGLEVRGLVVRWDGVEVLRGLDLRVGPGEFVTLMGPNGSGKSTLLRTLAGLEVPHAGAIRLHGRDLAGVPTHRRQVGLVFQESTMLPGRTVWENVAFAPELQHRPAREVEERVGEMLDLLRLRALAERPADALSGGERQRVALARTLAARPQLVLLDEPFASVDAELRAELRSEFRQVLRRVGASVLHVTHDREEGLFLGDRVMLLDRGQIVQSGAPADVFEAPRTATVARFLGYNVAASPQGLDAVHPVDVVLGDAGGTGVSVQVITSGPVGPGWVAFVELGDGSRWECRGDRTAALPRPGTSATITWTRSVRLPAEPPVKDLSRAFIADP